MNKFLIKALRIGISTIAIITILYTAYICYSFFPFFSACGMDDGPFTAIHINPIELSDSTQYFDLSNNDTLFLDNRMDTLSPILTLIEKGVTKWTLDTDLRNTKGYKNSRIGNIYNVDLKASPTTIKLNFVAYWSYGHESGYMEINRKNGDNTFCLSW